MLLTRLVVQSQQKRESLFDDMTQRATGSIFDSCRAGCAWKWLQNVIPVSAASCSEHVQVDAGMATVSPGKACSDLNAENAMIFTKE
jgi:hypothetical protein